MKKIETVWVKNNGSQAYQDRYDGEDFEIPAGQAIEMEASCATLCLGFGEEDKTRCLRRGGWATSSDQLKAGNTKLNEFSFHMSETETIASSAPRNGETTGRKTSSPSRPVEVPFIPAAPVEMVNALDKLSGHKSAPA